MRRGTPVIDEVHQPIAAVDFAIQFLRCGSNVAAADLLAEEIELRQASKDDSVVWIERQNYVLLLAEIPNTRPGFS